MISILRSEGPGDQSLPSPSRVTSPQPPYSSFLSFHQKNTVAACHRRRSHEATAHHCSQWTPGTGWRPGTTLSQQLCQPQSPSTGKFLLGSRAMRLQPGRGTLQTARPTLATCFPSARILILCQGPGLERVAPSVQSRGKTKAQGLMTLRA